MVREALRSPATPGRRGEQAQAKELELSVLEEFCPSRCRRTGRAFIQMQQHSLIQGPGSGRAHWLADCGNAPIRNSSSHGASQLVPGRTTATASRGRDQIREMARWGCTRSIDPATRVHSCSTRWLAIDIESAWPGGARATSSGHPDSTAARSTIRP